MGSFKDELNVLLFCDQLVLSSSNSVLVGTLYPIGQGLLTPLTPCHKLSFCMLRQLPVLDTIKFACAGWSVVLNVVVVAEFLHWWPSAPLPHWYKSPKAAESVLLVAAFDAPKFLSIQVLPVIGFVTSTTLVALPLQKTVPGLYKLLVGQGTSDDTPLHTYSAHLQVHNWSLQK